MNKLIKKIKLLLKHILKITKVVKYPHKHQSAYLSNDARVTSPEHLYMEEDTSIPDGAVIMNGEGGRFIFKKWSFASIDLLVICGNHMPIVGMPLIKVTEDLKQKLDVNSQYSKDVIVDEDVWIGARVTLMPGCHVGRGAIIAAGSVVTKSIPPYSVYGGVPAKFIKWKWSIEEIIMHENEVYPFSERICKNELVSYRELLHV